MKAFPLYTCFIGILFLSCSKQTPVPDCILLKIEEFKKAVCERGSSVEEYFFQSDTYFVFNYGPCYHDMGASVYDKQCNGVGSLGDRFGNSRINGEEFSNARLIRVIWEN